MCLAVPGEVIAVSDDEPLLRTARVRFGALSKEVALACVPQARVGDYVLVHAGIAIAVLDAAAAAQTLAAYGEERA